MTEKHLQIRAEGSPAGESKHAETHIVVVSQEQSADSQISLLELWSILWNGKWLIIAVTAAFTAIAIVYALTATEWYRSSVLLSPAESSGEGMLTELGGLGSLAGLAGVDIGGSNSSEPIAVLNSRNFTSAFIEDRELIPVLLADRWDEQAGRWNAEDPAAQPDIRDAVKYFDENVRSVSVDSDTGLVTLSIEWTDPVVAAQWADILVARLNNHMRQRALAEAEYNVSYLEKELSETTVSSLRQSISNILETELQKLMLARGDEEFAFRVIDSAQVPKEPVRPKRLSIIVVTTLLGGMFAILLVFFRHATKTRGAANGRAIASLSPQRHDTTT